MMYIKEYAYYNKMYRYNLLIACYINDNDKIKNTRIARRARPDN